MAPPRTAVLEYMYSTYFFQVSIVLRIEFSEIVKHNTQDSHATHALTRARTALHNSHHTTTRQSTMNEAVLNELVTTLYNLKAPKD